MLRFTVDLSNPSSVAISVWVLRSSSSSFMFAMSVCPRALVIVTSNALLLSCVFLLFCAVVCMVRDCVVCCFYGFCWWLCVYVFLHKGLYVGVLLRVC